MGNDIDSPIVAVDGGGTRCRVAVLHKGMHTVIERGSANISTSFDMATSEILRAIQDAFQSAGLDRNDISDAPAYVGLAGMTDSSLARRLEKDLPFRNVRIEDDRLAALHGALGCADGFLAHCGTGSFFIARTYGQVRGVGGWGPVLGDEASAQWIGRKALALTLGAADGLEAHSRLTRTLLTRFGTCADIVRFAGRAQPAEFGELAPLITECAETDDGNARKLMQMAADYIVSVLPRLGWTKGARICLTGGIGPRYEVHLPAEMKAELMPPVGTPLEGAIALAEKFAKEIRRERR